MHFVSSPIETIGGQANKTARAAGRSETPQSRHRPPWQEYRADFTEMRVGRRVCRLRVLYQLEGEADCGPARGGRSHRTDRREAGRTEGDADAQRVLSGHPPARPCCGCDRPHGRAWPKTPSILAAIQVVRLNFVSSTYFYEYYHSMNTCIPFFAIIYFSIVIICIMYHYYMLCN